MEQKYFDMLMSSLEDAAAFAHGDTSRARVVEVEVPDQIPECREFESEVYFKPQATEREAELTDQRYSSKEVLQAMREVIGGKAGGNTQKGGHPDGYDG